MMYRVIPICFLVLALAVPVPATALTIEDAYAEILALYQRVVALQQEFIVLLSPESQLGASATGVEHGKGVSKGAEKANDTQASTTPGQSNKKDTSSTSTDATSTSHAASSTNPSTPVLKGLENAIQRVQEAIERIQSTSSTTPPGLERAVEKLTCLALNRNLARGARGNDVAQLQRALIAQGHLAAGNDTGFFGHMTEQAVRHFQAARGLVSSGAATSTGFGAVGPRTRAAIGECTNAAVSSELDDELVAFPTTGPAPLTVTFTTKVNGKESCSAAEYALDFGDGASGDSTKIPKGDCASRISQSIHTYDAPGTYTATLNVSDEESLEQTASAASGLFAAASGRRKVKVTIVTVTSTTTLRAYATARGFLIGAAATVVPLKNETVYRNTLASEYNTLTPENEMKMYYLHPTATSYAFTDADTIVQFARDNTMVVRGHTLVWYQGLPNWLTNGNYTPTQKYSILRDHITAVVSHFATKYPGTVKYWDVVNEAMGDNSVLRTSIWSDVGTSTNDYIKLAFNWARAADPTAKLFYNDYSIEQTGGKSDAVYNMIKNLKQSGVPIDGVGLQMHGTASQPINITSLRANIARYAALGLEVHITEMDERIYISDGLTAAELTQQASEYGSILQACLAEPNCKLLTTWGFTDKSSWIPAFFPGYGAALPFDAQYVPKPAYTTLQNALKTQ